MSEANDKVKALRAKLAEAEATEKAERVAKREAERAARRAKDEADADSYREENYEVTSGPHNGYATASTGFNNGIEIGIAEWSTHQTSVTLTREEAQAFIQGIQKLLK